jgi:hypothetical protein
MTNPPTLSAQIIWLFILAIPVASVSWTIPHEKVFDEVRKTCVAKSESCRRWYERKFFYLFACEYCFSHYVVAFFLALARFRLLFGDWRGYFIAWFSLVSVANIYMSGFGRLRLDIKR